MFEEEYENDIVINKELTKKNPIYITTERRLAKINLTLMAQRLLYSIASMITPEDIYFIDESGKSSYVYQISLKQFTEIYGYKSIKIRTQLDKARKELRSISFILNNEYRTVTGLISDSEIRNNNINIWINPQMLKFYAVKGSSYELANIINFRAMYTFKMYEWFLDKLQDKKEAIIKIEINEFKEMLNVQEKYKSYHDMKRKIIEPVLKDINNPEGTNYCNIRVEMKEINVGTIRILKFIVKRYEQEAVPVITISTEYEKLSEEGRKAYHYLRDIAKIGNYYIDQCISKYGEKKIISVVEQAKNKKDIRNLNKYCASLLYNDWIAKEENKKQITQNQKPQKDIGIPEPIETPTFKSPDDIKNETILSILRLDERSQKILFDSAIKKAKGYKKKIFYKDALEGKPYELIMSEVGLRSLYKSLIENDEDLMNLFEILKGE